MGSDIPGMLKLGGEEWLVWQCTLMQELQLEWSMVIMKFLRCELVCIRVKDTWSWWFPIALLVVFLQLLRRRCLGSFRLVYPWNCYMCIVHDLAVTDDREEEVIRIRLRGFGEERNEG